VTPTSSPSVAANICAVVSADLVRGQYVDPDAGKIPFETYARKLDRRADL
jgi:hypothetical protein